MKQYCRYCAGLVAGNGTYCTKKNKEMSDSAAKHTNKCKDFELNPIDAFGETDGYKPRKERRSKLTDGTQLTIGEVEGREIW